MLATIEALGPERLRPIYEAHNETVPYEELHILRLYYLCRQETERVQMGEAMTDIHE